MPVQLAYVDRQRLQLELTAGVVLLAELPMQLAGERFLDRVVLVLPEVRSLAQQPVQFVGREFRNSLLQVLIPHLVAAEQQIDRLPQSLWQRLGSSHRNLGCRYHFPPQLRRVPRRDSAVDDSPL